MQGELGLVGFEHQGIVDPVTGLLQAQGQVVPPEGIRGGGLPVAPVQPSITGQQLIDIGGVDRTGVRHLDDHPVLPQ